MLKQSIILAASLLASGHAFAVTEDSENVSRHDIPVGE